jgi:hypothetical protein
LFTIFKTFYGNLSDKKKYLYLQHQTFLTLAITTIITIRTTRSEQTKIIGKRKTTTQHRKPPYHHPRYAQVCWQAAPLTTHQSIATTSKMVQNLEPQKR